MSNTTAKTTRGRGVRTAAKDGAGVGAIVDALVDEMQDSTASVVDPEKVKTLREAVLSDMAEVEAEEAVEAVVNEDAAALTAEEYGLLVYFFNRDKALKAEGYEATLKVRGVDAKIAPIEAQLAPLYAERSEAEARVQGVDAAIAQNAEQQLQFIQSIRDKFGIPSDLDFSFAPEPPHYILVAGDGGAAVEEE